MMLRLTMTGAAICILLGASGTAAAAPLADYSCETVKDLPPVSPYTKKVIERADNGIEYAKEGGAATDFLSVMPSWMLSVTSAWAGLTDTSAQRIDAVAELRSVSACLHFDLTLIDCKIDEVRTEIRAQSRRGSFIALIRLTSLLTFLNERRQHLTIGALDPQYPDRSWGYHYSFDRPETVWCTSDATENVCTEKSHEECRQENGEAYLTRAACEEKALPPVDASADNGRLCPFDANYAPAFDNGFGCDIELLEPRKAYPPVNIELEGLKAVSGALAEYRRTAVGVQKLQQQINELFGTPSPVAAPTPREHLNAFGCGWMGGWCDDDDAKRCTSDIDCADTCIFSDKVCKENRAIRCSFDSQCGGDGPCIEANEPPLRSTRGNFSLDQDQISTLTTFLGTRSQQEITRVFRDDLMTAAELPDTDRAKQEQRALNDTDPFFAIYRSSIRMAVQAWSRIQARSEVFVYPEAVDSPLETAHGLQDLHESIGSIARIANEKTGLREFVTRYASFLRLSCIYRPCSMLLEQAIRLSTTDECFPYTNGDYLNDDPGNPRWEKCKEAAEIE